MLFRRRTLELIAKGEVTLAFRRWKRAAVRPGDTLRTSIGVLKFETVERVSDISITAAHARRAGFASRAELFRELDARGADPIYRIKLRRAGDDPRLALRKKSAFAPGEFEALARRLARLDSASRRGPWTRRILELIRDHPGVRAGDLAPRMNREREDFKLDVRKLKNLGLTISLGTGYRISPRGRAALKRLKP